MASLRPRGSDDLGLRRALSDRLLPLLVAAMVFLAALAMAGAIAAAGLAAHWRGGAASLLTVQVPQPEGRAEAVALVLAHTPGLTTRRLDAAEVELNSARQFATSENVQVKSLEAQVAGIQSQIRSLQTDAHTSDAPTLAAMSLQTSEYLNLATNAKFAEVVYTAYVRALESITVEELSSNDSISLIQPAYLLPERLYNVFFLGMFFLLILLAVVAEFLIVNPFGGRR